MISFGKNLKDNKMLIHLLIQQHNYDEGNVNSAGNDPIAIALRTRLELPYSDSCVCGDDEIFFTRGKKYYSCPFDVKNFHAHWQRIPRIITLKFKEI